MPEGWLSSALAVNNRLAAHFKRNGCLFIDNWELFFENDTLLTCNSREVEVLIDSLEHSLNTLQDFFE